MDSPSRKHLYFLFVMIPVVSYLNRVIVRHGHSVRSLKAFQATALTILMWFNHTVILLLLY